MVLVPTRPGLAEHANLGWGSRVNSMLTVAPYALLNGYGFQWPVHICADADRTHPHCWFQPLSACGERAEQLCPEKDTFGSCGAWLNRFPTREEHITKKYHEPTADEIERACGSAAALIGSNADGCASKEDGALLAWRVIARLMMRPQPEIEERAARLVPAAFKAWAGGVYGAVHIRRRDKVFGNNAEAEAVEPCLYLERLATLSSSRRDLDVFVATDDWKILPTLPSCATAAALNWTIHHFGGGQPSRGIAADVTYRLWAEVGVMRGAAWCVATFSSNVGRLVQMLRAQPPDTMASMDRAGWFMRP